MTIAGLPPETWVLVAVISGFTVTMCATTIFKVLQYEERLQELISEVRDIRIMRGELPLPPGRKIVRRVGLATTPPVLAGDRSALGQRVAFPPGSNRPARPLARPLSPAQKGWRKI